LNVCASRLRKLIISDNIQARPEPAPAVAAPQADIEYDEMVLEAPAAEGATAAESAIAAGYDITEDSPFYEMYVQMARKFQQPEVEEKKEEVPARGEVFFDDDNEVPDDEEEKAPAKLGKKKRKLANLLSVAELKAITKHPEVVEWTDVYSSDPKALVAIKSHRNIVPVPTHWQLKREYLSGKRGIEKPQFALPKFIADTGIGAMRDAMLEKQAAQTLKQKQRERVQPKMGKMDIDYQQLHDAFFRNQTKPELTRFGEVYYEGKEQEAKTKHIRPGELSEELKEALNIPPGAPPPWLIAMQRVGPPPSYPGIRIPGLTAPLPPGGQWGYQPGGYGKPPIDEFNRPLFGGDIFGVFHGEVKKNLGEPVDKALWGELLPQEEEGSDEEESEEEEEAEAEEGEAVDTPGATSRGGFVPLEPTRVESAAGEFKAVKPRGGDVTATHSGTLYHVLEEKENRITGIFGSSRTYELDKVTSKPVAHDHPVLDREERGKKRKAGDVDVSVDVDALERDDRLSKEQIQRQYEASKQEEKAANPWTHIDQDDLSAMIAEESSKRLYKDQKDHEAKRARRR